MAVAFKIRILYLRFEFFTNTLELRFLLQSAGAVPAGTLKTLFHSGNHLRIGIESNLSHEILLCEYNTPKISPITRPIPKAT